MASVARHIGVDASRLVQEKRGMGRYVRNVLRELPLVRDHISYTIYAGTGETPDLRTLLQSMGETAGNAVIRPGADIAASAADVVWYPWNFVNPVARTAPIAVTIHDIAPMIQLDHRWWKMWKRTKYRRRYTNAVRRAHAILADSAFTAQEIQRLLNPDMSRVHEVLLASDDFAPGATDITPLLETLEVSGPFFMAVGAHEARKNLQVLFDAMRVLSARGIEVPLVLCGPGARLSKMAGRGDDRWLRYAGFVSDAELAALYNRATALVFPSLYEGFGLPPLEALQCGGRVVCADASSLPQVVGDAALLFPPRDVGALVEQLTRVVSDDALRRDLTRRGLQQAAKFTWRETARNTLAAFDAAMGRHAR
ncbi:MAG: glycosyltransferase family 4 protein [Phycisphaerae bacterium]|nr:glycosyltransferase family 4 protein [Gemmatimonadaceae bacterium]